jgi:hypothetical protein
MGVSLVLANPASEVRALAATEGVFVTGRVPDVRPFLAHATAAVAPMRLARGIQNKVLEAMARPVVATQDALEGIDVIAGAEVMRADTPEGRRLSARRRWRGRADRQSCTAAGHPRLWLDRTLARL